MSAIIFQIQSACILTLLFVGVGFAKRRKLTLHARLMGSAVAWDLLLVLQIELIRGAIEKAGTGPLLLNVHITIAALTIICYGVLIYTGRKLLSGAGAKVLPWHHILGLTALTLRTLTFATSFFIVSD